MFLKAIRVSSQLYKLSLANAIYEGGKFENKAKKCMAAALPCMLVKAY
jgi:hypothetical protein